MPGSFGSFGLPCVAGNILCAQVHERTAPDTLQSCVALLSAGANHVRGQEQERVSDRFMDYASKCTKHEQARSSQLQQVSLCSLLTLE